MALPKKVDRCPLTPGCTAKALYIDEDTGNIYHYNKHDSEFVSHKCRVRGSEKPSVVYVGEFFNRRTGRTRWVGPVRLKESAKKPPADTFYRKRGKDPDWKLVDIWESELSWKRTGDSQE